MSSEDHTSVAATLATEPGPNHLWKVSLYGKVIASKYIAC